MTIFNSVIWWWGWGWPKVPLNNISTLSVTAGDTEATIKRTDVWNLIVNGVLLNTWNATKLVRKVGSAPSDSSDWTLVTTETVADTYSSTGYTDTGLTNWTTYYYKAFSVGSNWLESGSNSADTTPIHWWQPWANTLAYYPLETDLLDHKTSWTLYNLTAYNWSDYSFTTNSQGKACMMMNSSSSNWTYFRSNLTLDFANKDYTFCTQVCDHLDMATTPACWLAFGSGFKWCPKLEDYAMGRPWWEFWSWWSSAWDTSLVSLKTSNFLCFITTWNHTTKSFTGYLNGVYRCWQNWASSINSYSDSLYLWKDPYNSQAWRSLHAKIRQVIIEEWIWDAETIQLYNDL